MSKTKSCASRNKRKPWSEPLLSLLIMRDASLRIPAFEGSDHPPGRMLPLRCRVAPISTPRGLMVHGTRDGRPAGAVGVCAGLPKAVRIVMEIDEQSLELIGQGSPQGQTFHGSHGCTPARTTSSFANFLTSLHHLPSSSSFILLPTSSSPWPSSAPAPLPTFLLPATPCPYTPRHAPFRP